MTTHPESIAIVHRQRLTTARLQRRLGMNRANFPIQHVVRLVVKKSTYSREQNLNQGESAIRR
ncbi:hypothetical protein MPL1032_100023 [Mesorhizobium plurifarium]|uniref:Uncharacterized protein n=1 Tax=Mesorhizobium plurifarium TaxID=69974 RepID=A0A0K2VNS1_MESPL|nr:hypothetical protein MPL1032_100023 [Mesorhizobium plurifarium]